MRSSVPASNHSATYTAAATPIHVCTEHTGPGVQARGSLPLALDLRGFHRRLVLSLTLSLPWPAWVALRCAAMGKETRFGSRFAGGGFLTRSIISVECLGRENKTRILQGGRGKHKGFFSLLLWLLWLAFFCAWRGIKEKGRFHSDTLLQGGNGMECIELSPWFLRNQT